MFGDPISFKISIGIIVFDPTTGNPYSSRTRGRGRWAIILRRMIIPSRSIIVRIDYWGMKYLAEENGRSHPNSPTPAQKSFALAKVGVTVTKVTVKQRIRDKTAAFFMVFSPFLFFMLAMHQVKRQKNPF
jgi:hypothetical protein